MTRRHWRHAGPGIAALLVLFALAFGATPVQARGATGKLLSGASVSKPAVADHAQQSEPVAAKRIDRPQSNKTTVAPTTTTTASAPTASASTTASTPTTTRPTTTAPTTLPAVSSSTTTLPAAPTSTPTSTTVGPKSSSMPVGDLPGWKQVFTEDFVTAAPVGSFVSTYGERWSVYDDGWKDSAGKSEGTSSAYYPSRVVSVQNGLLNKRLHTENGVTMVAAIGPNIGAQLYGRYAVRFRADEVQGFKTAWLLWPSSGVWPRDGEIDFPEGALDGNIWAFGHRQGATSGSDQDAFATAARYGTWHTATIEWTPSSLVFLLDDQVVGRSTSRVPSTPMEWILQSETCLGACQPSPSAVANIEIDWVVAYSYRP